MMTDKEFHTRLGTPPSYHAAIKSFEHDLFERALRKANKSPSKAARLVGLPHTSFIKRLARHPDLERTPIKPRQKRIIQYDYYVVISSVGPNALNVAKILSQIPQHQNQEQLLRRITQATDDISLQVPKIGRARHLVKLLRAQKAKVRIESIPTASNKRPKQIAAHHR
jgi:hypothetical protein